MTNSISGLKGRLKQFDNTIIGKAGHGGADRVRFKHQNYEQLIKTYLFLFHQTIDFLWTSIPIKSILDCVMPISESVNEGLYFHIMALAALVANPRRTEIGSLWTGESLCLEQRNNKWTY